MQEARSISTISEFLLHAGTEYIVLDVSRGIRIVDNQRFFEYENCTHAFPHPRQTHAWLCIMFWNKKLNSEHYIWYVKLPVDENSLIVAAARDQFLQIVVDALGKSIDDEQRLKHGLPENPCVFTPSQQMRADCNAKFKKYLADNDVEDAFKPLDDSSTWTYLQAPSVQRWETLSVQNIADIIVFADQTDIEECLLKHLEQYPGPVLNCILSTLEGISISEKLSKYLGSLFYKYTQEQALILRALTNGNLNIKTQLIDDILATNDKLDVELLVVIAGRHWHLLRDSERLSRYMKKVAEAMPDFTLFKGIYSDLVQIPSVRDHLLDFLRNPERSDVVASAIGDLLSSTGHV